MAFSFNRSFFRRVIKEKEVYILKWITLSVAFACTILVGSFTYREFSVNRFHREATQLVRLLQRDESKKFEGRNRLSDRIPSNVYTQLLSDSSEFLIPFRVKTLKGVSLITEENEFEPPVIHAVDPTLYQAFSLYLEQGQPTLSGLVLSSAAAGKLFNSTACVGKAVNLFTNGDTLSYAVSGVFQDFPATTHEPFEIFIPFQRDSLSILGFSADDFSVYGRIAQNSTREALTALQKKISSDSLTYSLQSFTEIYFGPRVIGENARHGNSYSVLILICISGLILMLAVNNYVNLSILTLPRRSTEIAIRKVAGAHPLSVLFDLCKEWLMLTGLSLITAMILLVALVPSLERFLHVPVSQWMSADPYLIFWFFVLFLLVSFSPLYPAIVFVRASPRRLLSVNTITFPTLKRIITIVQLGISVSLIVAGLVVHRQITRSLIKEPGKNHEQVLAVRSHLTEEQFNGLQSGWPVSNPNILQVAGVSHLPDDLNAGATSTGFSTILVDPVFMNFFHLQMQDGWWFGPNDHEGFVVNAGAATKTENVIGIIDDWHGRFNLPFKPVRIGLGHADDFNFILIKVLEVDIRITVQNVQHTFNALTGEKVEVSFLDKGYEATLLNEDSLGLLSALLTLVSIILSGCAIYALSMNRIQDNLKQIAVRRTFGATLGDIVILLLLEFVRLLLASLFFFGPLTYFLLTEWLRNFAYAARLQWQDPLISLLICLFIVMISNTYLIIRLGTSRLVIFLRT